MSLRTLLRAAPVDGTMTLDSYPTDATPPFELDLDPLKEALDD